MKIRKSVLKEALREVLEEQNVVMPADLGKVKVKLVALRRVANQLAKLTTNLSKTTVGNSHGSIKVELLMLSDYTKELFELTTNYEKSVEALIKNIKGRM